MIKNRITAYCLMCLAALIFSGCASQNAVYVESGGARTIISTNKIDVADWNSAASTLVSELLSSGAIDKTGLTQPVRMKVSRIINRTSGIIDTDMISRQICIVLNNSGKVMTVSDDEYTKELANSEALSRSANLDVPKLTMTGKIIEVREMNDDKREVTYIFFLEVNYRGGAIWMGQKQITKQSDRGAFGW